MAGAPLRIGPLAIDPPVVLAPMAGVTNWPFRTLCRDYGAGLYVSEMITARPLVEGREKTHRLADFGEDETPEPAPGGDGPSPSTPPAGGKRRAKLKVIK